MGRGWIFRRRDSIGAGFLVALPGDIAGEKHADHKCLTDGEFQLRRPKANEVRPARLTCHDGNANICFSKPIAFGDFPPSEITFYCAINTIFLRDEY
jgi:hypothetical protein